MGGHGGLNILPQKPPHARNSSATSNPTAGKPRSASTASVTPTVAPPPSPPPPPPSPPPSSLESGYINLFHGLKSFSSLIPAADHKKSKREASGEDGLGRDKKRKKEEPPWTVGPEDEQYRMGYDMAGKGVKVPWYLAPSVMSQEGDESVARRGK